LQIPLPGLRNTVRRKTQSESRLFRWKSDQSGAPLKILAVVNAPIIVLVGKNAPRWDNIVQTAPDGPKIRLPDDVQQSLYFDAALALA
jgi:hypothetical protein